MATKRGWAIWLTGLPAAGKTTLAAVLRRRLDAAGVAVVILDSDEVRSILTPAATYLPHERDMFYERLVELTALLTSYGTNVIIAATGNRRAYRERARELLSPYAEVWLRCPLEVCRARDPKHLYEMADSGEIAALPGVGSGYEPPDHPDLIIDTDAQPLEAAADAVLSGLYVLGAAPGDRS